MIKFCHIAPTDHLLHAAAHSQKHMALHHLVEEGLSNYTEKFRTISNEGGYIYLDNSQFELGEPCTIEDLLASAKIIQASCLILPDGDISTESIAEIKGNGYDVMVIPAGRFFSTDFIEALRNPDVDYVGLSYSKTSEFLNRPRHSTTSRFDFLNYMKRDADRLEFTLPPKKIHMLGMVTAGELSLMKPYEYAIESWDSSIAVWGGLCNSDIKNMSEKNPESVDFSSDRSWNLLCQSNIDYIKMLQNL